jgi:cytochrome P450 family 3 subfamily A
MRIDSTTNRTLAYYSKKDYTLNGVFLPKGQLFFIGIGAMMNNPEIWENPREYIPERFIADSKYFATPSGERRNPTTYSPFGIGPRSCVG